MVGKMVTSKAKANPPLFTDHLIREQRMMSKGSRLLCAAILAADRTYGPCNVAAALEYAREGTP